MKVAVIGAGAAGSASARFLAKAGHEVHVFEQFAIGHAMGSSHGTSRITRKSYPDPYYTELMHEAYPLWMELQEEAGEPLYKETGLLIFGKQDAPYLRDSRNSLHQNRVPFEPLGPIEVAKRFHGFHLDPDEEAIFQTEAGYLLADRVILANLRLAERNGATLHAGTRAMADESGEVNGEQFDAVAVCAGAWTSSFAKLDVKPHLQHFAYFSAPIAEDLPVWVDAAKEFDYGLPNYGKGFKIGRHMYGPQINPDNPDRTPNSETVASLFETARKRLGATALLESSTCVYTVAPNEDFRFGQLPWRVPAYYITGCSGHGFKFTQWFGRLMKEFIEGTRSPSDYPRFQGIKQ